jgi:hypothetical protein
VSLDIFISAITDDEGNTFDRAIVERAFKSIVVNQSGDYWNLQTPQREMTGAAVFIEDAPRISHFSVNRPPDYDWFPEFWNAMFEVLRQTNTFLFWPAHGQFPHCCLANPNLIPQISAEIIDALGKPALVTSGAETEAVLVRSFS